MDEIPTHRCADWTCAYPKCGRCAYCDGGCDEITHGLLDGTLTMTFEAGPFHCKHGTHLFLGRRVFGVFTAGSTRPLHGAAA